MIIPESDVAERSRHEGRKSNGGIVLLRQFTKSPLFPLCQRGKLLSPSLAKGSTRLTILSLSKERGEGRFSEQYVYSIMDSLVFLKFYNEVTYIGSYLHCDRVAFHLQHKDCRFPLRLTL